MRVRKLARLPVLMSTPTRLALRLDALSRDELLELAAGALDELPKGHHLRNQADALVAKRKPLPAWCVDGVLLSPDLLPHLFESLSLRDCAAAAACSAWSGAWVALLRLRRYVHPVPRRIDLSKMAIEMRMQPRVVAAMPDGALCVAGTSRLRFLTAQGELIPGGGAWAALAQVEFDETFGVLRHEDSLLVVDHFGQHVRQLRLSDGIELARSPDLEACVYEAAIAGDRLFVPSGHTISVLDIATLELRYSFGEFETAVDCAIQNDEVYVADQHDGGELNVFTLAGKPLRTVRGTFGIPICISIKDDRIYMIEQTPDRSEDEFDERQERGEGRRLVVLELDGTIRQEIRVGRAGEPGGMRLQSLCFLGDELWIPDYDEIYRPSVAPKFAAMTVLRFV